MKKTKPLPKTKLKKFRTMFLEIRAKLLNAERPLVDDFNAGDEVDIAQGMVINEMVEKLSNRDKELLVRIGEAIKRIDDGSFGFCEECEEVIPEPRLVAVPYCTFCIACAEEQEKIAKQYRQ